MLKEMKTRIGENLKLSIVRFVKNNNLDFSNTAVTLIRRRVCSYGVSQHIGKFPMSQQFLIYPRVPSGSIHSVFSLHFDLLRTLLIDLLLICSQNE